MTQSRNIRVEIKSRLAVITLTRPKKKNAISADMYIELTRALEEISENDDVSITAITGEGDYYCSGTDLTTSLNFQSESLRNSILEASNRLKRFIAAFINHSKILVAIVNGPAIGIGVTTLALCDIVYCSDTATFQTPFVRLGMSAEGCSSYTFPRLMGTSKANEVLLFNYKMTAQEALRVGLVAQVYTREELTSVVRSMLEKNAQELPAKSLKYSKRMIRRFDVSHLHEANRVEIDRLEERWNSEDCMNAFLQFMNRRSKM